MTRQRKKMHHLFVINYFMKDTAIKKKASDISTLDSYFRTAIGFTPDGPVMYSGSYTCFINTISIEKRRRLKKDDS